MNRYLSMLLILVISIAAFSCKKQASITQSVSALRVIEIDKPAELKIGEVVTLKSKDLDISFSEVTNDSRCPINADCIHQGSALLKIMVGEEEKEIKFEKGKENLTTVNAITLQILELNPIKNIDIPFNKDDYNLTLVIKNLTEE